MQWCADVEPEVGAAFVDTMRLVQLAGGEVVPVTLPELEQLRVAHLMTIGSEMRQAMKPYTKVRASRTGATRQPVHVHPSIKDWTTSCSAAVWIAHSTRAGCLPRQAPGAP